MVGIIEEQHPDRARLFMQWKQMNWPILVDSLDLLNVSAVPITVAIDEFGIVRAINPEKETIEETFLKKTYAKPTGQSSLMSAMPDLKQLKAEASERETAQSWRFFADAIVLWGGNERIMEAIEAYQAALRLEPKDASTHFHLGVAFRKKYESAALQPGDFQEAINHWKAALDLNPNQYIWRRRIQQYGPRLDKPYSFYDWVNIARKEILARGEKPVPLAIEPSGAEFAHPSKDFPVSRPREKEPDPDGRITRDHGEFIRAEVTSVPPSVSPGSSIRFHLLLRPNLRKKAHWNNEVGNLLLWVNPPREWTTEFRAFTVANPPQPVSQEVRRIELEVKCPANAKTGEVVIPGYVLYYVCEDVHGTCLYRRQDVLFKVMVR
jgi:tetratricopeptide (TPR) repeat protein